MKPIVILALLLSLSSTVVFGQVKIGDNPQNINAASVLELESNNQVLVITRVNNQAMESITPLRGAVVYNTDTQCLHYYNGTEWINLCDAVSFSLTNDPIENITTTISIVDNGGTINLELAPNSIRSENIVDGGINGDDIQDNSIGESKLGADAVGANELRDNSVGTIEIIDGSITPADMSNSGPNQVLTTDATGLVNWVDASNVSGVVTDVTTITGTGIAGDELTISDAVQNAISVNSQDIAEHIGTDMDTDDRNELTDLSYDAATNTLSLTRSDVGTTVNLDALNNAGTDNQNLNLTATNVLEIERGNTVDLNPILLAAADGDETIINPGTNITISGDGTAATPYIINAADGVVADGSETEIIEGANITITGNGTNATPYVINAADGVVADGSETQINQGANIIITGNGTTATPYIITAEDAVGDGSETQINQGANITITGNGTNATPYIINADIGAVADGSETKIIEGTNITITGNGTNASPYVINSIGGSAAAADITFNPIGNTTSNQVQLAIEELQTEIDGISTGGAANPNDELITTFSLTGTELNIAEGVNILAPIDLDLTFATDVLVNSSLLLKEDAANKSNDPTLIDNSATDFPTEQAVKTYVDTQVGAITAQTIVSGDAGNSITASGTDGGAFYDDSALTTATTANATVIAANTTAIGDKEDAANKSNDPTLIDNSATDFPTEQAVKTYVDTQVGAITAQTIVSGDAGNSITTSGTDGGAFYDDSALTTATTANAMAITANTTAIGDKEDAVNKSNDPTLIDNSATDFPTEQAVKTYVDTQVGAITAPTIVSGDAGNSITTSGTDGGAFYEDSALIAATVANALAITTKEDAANKSADGTLAGNSDVDFPTEQAVKTYVDTQIGSVTAGNNLANADLILNADRTHDLNGSDLVFVDNSGGPITGNIGIGNLPGAPQDKLDVAGQIRARNGFASTGGTAITPGFGFYTDGDTNTGMFRPAADEIGFSAGGEEALRVEEDGGNTNVIVFESLELNNLLLDKDGEAGTAGQILSSTGTQTDWINAPTGGTAYTAGAGIAISGANEISLNAGTLTADWNNITNIPVGFDDDIDNDTQYTAGTGIAISGANEISLNAGTLTADWNNLTNIPVGFDDDIDNDTQYTAGTGIAISGANEISLNVGTITPGSITANLIETNPTFTGALTAGSFISATTTYPDYVFQKYFLGKSSLKSSYEFASLESIEVFLKQNHHLPGVKSALDVEANRGKWNLTEGALINLEKIEELFLHTIEQEKKIKELKSSNTKMAKEMELLKAQMEEIKKMVLARDKN